MIAVRQQRITYRLKRSRLIAAEVVRENQIESSLRFRFVLVVPMLVVPGLACLNLLNCQAEQE